jgi:hypothetical protein
MFYRLLKNEMAQIAGASLECQPQKQNPPHSKVWRVGFLSGWAGYQLIVAIKATCTLIERKNPTPQATHSVQVLRRLLRGSLSSITPIIRITVPTKIISSDVLMEIMTNSHLKTF